MLTDKAIANHVDATWNGYIRARFVQKVSEIINEDTTHALYLEVKKSKEKLKKDKFIAALGRGGFVGTVCFHALRVFYGD